MAIEAVFDGFQDALGVDVVTFAGPKQVDETAKPPRITWQPISARHTSPKRIDGGPGDDGPILTREWLIKVDVWGSDLAETETLADLFLAIAHDKLSQYSYRPGEEPIWKATGQAGDGTVMQILFTVQSPILRLPLRTVTLKQLRTTMGLGSPPATPVVSNFTKG